MVSRPVALLLSIVRHYCDSGEPYADRDTRPNARARLERFSKTPVLSRLLNSGNDAIHFLRTARGASYSPPSAGPPF